MSGAEATRQRQDEDTQVGYYGHITNQALDRPEQASDDRKRQQPGPERSPDQENPDQHKGKKRDRNIRK
jgi:hypothetical protein